MMGTIPKIFTLEQDMHQAKWNAKSTLRFAIAYSLIIIVLILFGTLTILGTTISFSILFIHNLVVYIGALRYWLKYKKLFYDLVVENL